MSTKEPAGTAVNKALSGNKAEPIKSLVAMPSEKRLEFFKAYEPLISTVLPQGNDLNAARIVSLAVQLTGDTAVQNCTPKSIVGAVMQSVILGFEPIPGLGLAAFIPYGGKLHFQIEYKGYIDLCYRTNMYDDIYAEVVRDGDEFDYWRGTDPGMIHKPKSFSGKLTYVYAVAHLKGSARAIFRVLTREEVLEIRDHYSQAYRAGKKDSPWFGKREMEMWKKTAILQLQKDLPKSITVQKAMASDEKAISLDDFNRQTKEVDLSKLETAEWSEDKDEPAPEQKPAPEPKPATAPVQADAVAPVDETPDTMLCVRCGELYHPKNVSEANFHLTCNKPTQKPKSELEPEQHNANGLDKPLNKVFPQQDAMRKIKYIREEFTKSQDAFVQEGVMNLGAFCRRHKVEALSGSDITVQIYEDMKADILAVRKKHN